MKKKGPADNYASDSKAASRRWVWDEIDVLREIPKPEGVQAALNGVLFLEETGGFEIQEARRRGYNRTEIHPCNMSAGVVATLTKKYGDSCCRWRGNVAQIAKEFPGKLLAVHLDFCQQLDASLLRTLAAVTAAPSTEMAVVFVNLLRGRDEAYLQNLTSFEREEETLGWLRSAGEKVWMGPPPTLLDVRRLRALARAAGENWHWGCARVYTSSSGQSFVTVRLAPSLEEEEAGVEYDTSMTALSQIVVERAKRFGVTISYFEKTYLSTIRKSMEEHNLKVRQRRESLDQEQHKYRTAARERALSYGS